MARTLGEQKKLLKKLNNELKDLKAQQVIAKKAEGIDDYIKVKIGKRQAHFKRIIQKGKEDRLIGNFLIEMTVTAKDSEVLIPLSIASGKKTAGLMYYIEGTAEGKIVTAGVTCRGEGVMQIKQGTLVYAKIPPGKVVEFRILAEISGRAGQTYKIVINRLNYKLNLAETLYKQYLKPIISDSVKFS